jgi:type I restriction enzyme S subunit
MKLVEIGDICNLQNGKAFKPSEWSEEGAPIVRIQNLNNERKPFNYCDFEVDKKFKIDSGDLLFSWSGTPGTSFGAFFWDRGPAVLNQHIFNVLVNEQIVRKDYLRLAMNAKLNEIIGQAHGGVGLQHITKGKLEAIKIPLPSLETQKQIAEVLEKSNQLRKDCQQMEQEFNILAHSIFIDMFGDPTTNSKGWETTTLDNVARVQIGPFGTQLHKHDYVSNGIPLINPTHISKGKIVPNNDLTLTQEKYDELPNYHLKLGDIIMGRRGEMGRTSLIDEKSEGWFCGTGSLYVRPKNKQIDSVYLNSVLSCGTMKKWLEDQSLGATMANLNKKILHSIVVPMPPVDLQVKYGLALKTLETQKEDQCKLFEELDILFQSLIQKAFKGELNLNNTKV